ncbi:hypothetical protein MJO28_005556 [Puccinia striiformis f. sp. tritici]|uniref:GH16 domain-containing protein n=2 Tax=Puccinia striiformis f. sp. tritici TaxID=168172 RepID=A0A0L0V790_9BASI|nr:hypothetical protein MJO28_005556 [Puccinia striiformis f. sp. tritici]KAI9611989.1 hypothetical protein H4Q26_008079 [Puccinia striiformis f. sp. tritici PST-130]KNE94864.1 hypothetical protein PSTG_11768 [Puccinia striiformis f. sp. tritici PST-78]
MTSPYPHEEQFYAEVPQRRNRPSSTSSVSPFFMSHQSPTAGGGSDPSYGQGRYDWVHNGTQVSRNPSSNLSKATTDRSSDNYASEAPENAAKHSYGAAHLGFLNDELLSPGAVDEMHDFEKKTPRIGASRYISEASGSFTLWSPRGWLNICALLIMVCGLMMLFAGWPILSYFKEHSLRDLVSGFGGQKNLGGYMRAPTIPSFRELIDPDTPRAARHRVGADGEEYELVFSDEFNVDGRTFWKGDDPFWEAADQHYWPTGDREWYDPDAARTEGGSLVIKIMKMDPNLNHNLEYRSAMLTGWNKLCFTGGYMETGVTMPGRHDVGGFWPAIWTMGNLARPGFGATTDGTWPFSYDSCDVGAMPNQTHPKTGAPGSTVLTSEVGDLSWQPGQKLSRCTCAAEDHPGPKMSDGTYKGRSSPEIDMVEAYSWEKSATSFGSQSLQIAPYDDKRIWDSQVGSTYSIHTESGFRTNVNPYHGGNRQQTLSALATLPQSNFELSGNQSLPYGLEWAPDQDNSHITWSLDHKPTWTLNSTALKPNPRSMVGQRLISNEPMYMILNLGLSDTFVPVNEAQLVFPAYMRFDYVRFYQRKGHKNVGCSPKDYPTEKYINDHWNAYQDTNLTTWSQAGYTFPKTTLMDGCKTS